VMFSGQAGGLRQRDRIENCPALPRLRKPVDLDLDRLSSHSSWRSPISPTIWNCWEGRIEAVSQRAHGLLPGGDDRSNTPARQRPAALVPFAAAPRRCSRTHRRHSRTYRY